MTEPTSSFEGWWATNGLDAGTGVLTEALKELALKAWRVGWGAGYNTGRAELDKALSKNATLVLAIEKLTEAS